MEGCSTDTAAYPSWFGPPRNSRQHSTDVKKLHKNGGLHSPHYFCYCGSCAVYVRVVSWGVLKILKTFFKVSIVR